MLLVVDFSGSRKKRANYQIYFNYNVYLMFKQNTYIPSDEEFSKVIV